MSFMGSDEATNARYLAMLARATGARAAERVVSAAPTGPWRAVQTVARGEWLAAGHLGRAGFEVFLPHRTTTVMRGRRAIGTARALFAGYLFARIGDGGMRAAHAAEGVVGVVRFGEAFAAVPDEAVDILLALCDDRGCWRADVPRAALGQGEVIAWAVGEVVRILSGPFEGFEGEVTVVDAARGIGVDIDIFGRPTRVTVPRTDLGSPDGPRPRGRRGRKRR